VSPQVEKVIGEHSTPRDEGKNGREEVSQTNPQKHRCRKRPDHRPRDDLATHAPGRDLDVRAQIQLVAGDAMAQEMRDE
jgi:hypothetical protein